MYRCLCCGSKTLPVDPKDAIAFICPVCWWENDVFISADDEPSDENHQLTLEQGRRNYNKCGISDPWLIIRWAENDARPWSEIIQMLCKNSSYFEIHCWEDEINEINLALQYGILKRTDWEKGSVIAGKVTSQFKNMLYHLPKPHDTEAFQKKTPFFSIFFDNGFSSEHYGTEINYMEEN